jgi:glycine/D-amino acid oxidase-like deaminating enzyme
MHVVVVGAGVFGVWTAHHLRNAGVRVTLVDAYGPGNSRSSSGDESRIVRCGYGPDAIYTRMAWQSLREWKAFDARHAGAGAPLWHPCGVLWLCGAGDPYLQATIATLERESVPAEVLDAAALRTAWPHLSAGDVEMALREPFAGVVSARRAVAALAAELTTRGVTLLTARVLPPAATAPIRQLVLSDGARIEADAYVFACGPWLPALFPEFLRGRIRPTRQAVIYFGTPGGDARFGHGHTPAWVDFPAGVYGVPDIDGRGVKVGIDRHGPEFDPDRGERLLDEDSAAHARRWLERRFPSLAGAPILESRVCQYENTSTGDFLIDRHPDNWHVWIVGGGSGHGFKHGPAVGQYVAQQLTGGGAAEPRFALGHKGAAPARQVY